MAAARKMREITCFESRWRVRGAGHDQHRRSGAALSGARGGACHAVDGRRSGNVRGEAQGQEWVCVVHASNRVSARASQSDCGQARSRIKPASVGTIGPTRCTSPLRQSPRPRSSRRMQMRGRVRFLVDAGARRSMTPGVNGWFAASNVTRTVTVKVADSCQWCSPIADIAVAVCFRDQRPAEIVRHQPLMTVRYRTSRPSISCALRTFCSHLATVAASIPAGVVSKIRTPFGVLHVVKWRKPSRDRLPVTC